MSRRDTAILVGPVILAMLVALVAIPLGYGRPVGPWAVAAAFAWLLLHTAVSWLLSRRRRE